MTGTKTNERPGTRAVVRGVRMSATKARQVLDLIRDEEVGRAAEILRDCPRAAAEVVAKALASAVANASNNDDLEPDELYVAACYADEGPTLRRFRPRARGRATRIRKRSCHVTVIVAELPEERLRRHRSRREAEQAALRARRVAGGRRLRGGSEAAGPGRAEDARPAAEVERSATETSDVGLSSSGTTAPESTAPESTSAESTLSESTSAESTLSATSSSETRAAGADVVLPSEGQASEGQASESAELASAQENAGALDVTGDAGGEDDPGATPEAEGTEE